MIGYLIALLLFLVVYWVVTHKKDPRLPPGDHGWPIVGSLPSSRVAPVHQVENYRKKYGDVFFWKIGSQNCVFICDPKILKKAFQNPLLTDRPKDFFTIDSWSYFKKIGIINSNGNLWQSHRRFALQHLRDSGFGKSIVQDIINLEAEVLVQDIKDNFLDKPVPPPLAINVATVNVIWRLVADLRFDRNDKDLQVFFQDLTNIFVLIQGYITLFDVFPSLVHITPKFVMDKIGFTKLQDVREDIRTYLKKVVEERRAKLNRDNPFGLIDGYLMEMEDNNADKHFDEESLIISLGDLFVAGSETTATTVRWALQYMARYPEVQKRIQKEIDSVVPKDRLPNIGDKPNLPYTEATTYEALRFQSLLLFGVHHAAREDTTIEQYHIPKGTVIVPYLYGCQRNPKFWAKPNEFYPENFIDSDGKFTSKNDAFLPFSTGRRICLGESLARTELFLFFSALLQKFSFHAPEGEEVPVDMDPASIMFSIIPQAKIVIKERT